MSMLTQEAVAFEYNDIEAAVENEELYEEAAVEEAPIEEVEIAQGSTWSFWIIIILPLLIAVIIIIRLRAKQKQIITKCPYCDKEIMPDSKYCEYCGKKIK